MENQERASENTFIQAMGNKHLLSAMQQQHENLKLQQKMLEDQKLVAYLNHEAAQFRLELALLLVENPDIVKAMEAGNSAAQMESEIAIDISEDTDHSNKTVETSDEAKHSVSTNTENQ